MGMKSKLAKKIEAITAAGIMIISSLMLTACTVNSNSDVTSQAAEEGMLIQKNYYELSNHSWKTEEYVYKYKLELGGELPNTNRRANFIILTNREVVTFEEVLAASGLGSSKGDYFEPEDSVIVALWVEEENGSDTKLYENQYYSIDIPVEWSIAEENDYEVIFRENDVDVATIIVEPEYDFSKTTSSIISNWLGMHAYIEDEWNDVDFSTYTMKKVKIGYELSAAQEIEGEFSSEDELHYFYISKEGTLFIDLFMESSGISENESDVVANSLELF
jgi:hypothetical protein